MKLWNKFATAAILPLMFAAGQASAADAVDCGQASNWVDQSVINQQMGAANQSIYAKASFIEGAGKDARASGVIFTSNEDGSEGYIVRTDKMPGQKSTQGCIAKRMTGLRFNDASKPGVSNSVLLNVSEDAALKGCADLAAIDAERFPRASCISLNKSIRNAEPSGDRVMAQGFDVKKKPDGTYVQSGWLTTISANYGLANPNNPAAGIASSIKSTALPSGATFINATLAFAKYTDHGIAMLKGRNLAMN